VPAALVTVYRYDRTVSQTPQTLALGLL